MLGATGLATMQVAAGCSLGTGGVEVFVMWSGGELEQFARVMADFTKATKIDVRIVPVAEAVHELLQARIDAGNPPDLAIVPLPGLIQEQGPGVVSFYPVMP